MDDTKNISVALTKCQAEMTKAAKSGENKFDKYYYSTIEDYLDVARPHMTANGLALLVNVVGVERLPDRKTVNDKTEHAVQVHVQGVLIHTSGESLLCEGWGEGQDRADKAIYKAITGAKKYLVSSLFCIPTTDDPEATQDGQPTGQPPATPPKAPAPQRPATPAPAKPATPPAKAPLKPPVPASQVPPVGDENNQFVVIAGKKKLSDPYQLKHGLVTSPQVKELRAKCTDQKIAGDKFVAWLKVYTAALAQSGHGTAIDKEYNIRTDMYGEIVDIVDKSPAAILNPGQPEVAGDDDIVA